MSKAFLFSFWNALWLSFWNEGGKIFRTQKNFRQENLKYFIDENFDAKFQRLVEAEVFPKEMELRLVAHFADENAKSMRELFQTIYSVGVELDMPNYRIEKIINKAIQILN